MSNRDVQPDPSRNDRHDAEIDALLARLPGARTFGPDAPADPRDPHIDDRALLALQAGRLSELEAAQVESHLGRCAACRALLVELDVPVSAALQSAAEQAARSGSAGTSARGGTRRPGRLPVVFGVLAAAGLALAIGLGRTPDGVSHPDFDWTREYAAEPMKGGVQAVRTATAAAESRRVQPESVISWTLRAAGTDKVPEVGVYVGSPGAALRAVGAAKVVRAAGGTVRVQATGQALGGSDFGALVWVVALTGAPVDLSGRPVDTIGEAVAPGEGVVFTKVLTYEPEVAP